MLFEANKKSTVVAYLLWLFLGGFGGHRFYCGEIGSAVAQLVLMIFGLLLSLVLIGIFVILGLSIWVLVDAFLIPGWIRNYNTTLVAQLSSGAPS